MKLREYQTKAIESLVDFISNKENRGQNPCVVAPTGAGKSILIAETIRYYLSRYPSARFLVCVHTKELIKQNCEKFKIHYPEVSEKVGIYSAGLKSKDFEKQIVFCGIQTAAKKALWLGHRDFLIVDEAHHIPKTGNGQYRKFIEDLKKINKFLVVVGYTATPYRTSQGFVYGPGDKGFILNKICYEISIKELIRKGYLTKPTTQVSENKIDTSKIKVVRGEFQKSELEKIATKEDLLEKQIEETIKLSSDRKSVLIFSVSKKHCEQISELLKAKGQSVDYVHSGISTRNEVLEKFTTGKIKFLVNVNVLTEGFDYDKIDCVVFLRATASPGLYYQIIGRGLRIHKNKTDVLIIDYGENIKRHGPIDKIRIREKGEGEAPVKFCAECKSLIPASSNPCPECGFIFEQKEIELKLLQREKNLEVLSTKPKEYSIQKVEYSRHKGKKEKPDTLKIEYFHNNVKPIATEWFCLDHSKDSFPFRKAQKDLNSAIALESVQHALDNCHKIRQPQKIVVDLSEKYPKILRKVYKNEANTSNPSHNKSLLHAN